MTTRKVTTLHCEWCDTSDMTETYSITVNGQKYEFEACPKDYLRHVAEPFAVIARVGRKVTPETVSPDEKYSRRSKTAHMPGTDWRFTPHALIRMGERRIDPTDVIAVADNPQTTFTSETNDDLFVYTGEKNIRLTVDPSRKVIVTAALRDRELVSTGNQGS